MRRTKSTGWVRGLFALALTTAASAGGCQCGDAGSGIAKLHGELGLDPTELPFGDVPVGATAELQLHLSDRGELQLQLCVEGTDLPECEGPSHVEPSSAPFSAALSPDAPGGAWIVEKGATRDLTVRFSPVSTGPASATLVLVHDGSNGPTTEVRLTGNGVEPRVDFTDTLDFGAVTVGRRRTLDLTLTNGTSFAAPVTIAPITQSSVVFGTEAAAGGDTPPSSAFTGEVPANGALTVRVWYQPTDVGPSAATLHVSYCATCAKDVALTGTGVKPTFVLEPPALDFGAVELGAATAQAFSVVNRGTSPVTVSSIGLEAGTPVDFVPAPEAPLPHTIAPGESLVVDVALVASQAGPRTGRVRVETEAWDDPTTGVDESIGFVVLSAEASGAVIAASPAQLTFGVIPVGSLATRALVVQNLGDRPLRLDAIELAPADPSLTLSGVPALPASLDAGGSVRLVVSYHPSAAGSVTSAVVINSSDHQHPSLSLPVTGTGGTPTGCALAVLPSQLAFGIVERGRTATMPVTFRNLGPVACHLTNLALSGDPVFALGSSAAVVIAPSASEQVQISYAPQAYGTSTGVLSATSDDPSQPNVSVPLTGASAPDSLRVVPSALDFGVVQDGCSSPSRTVTLYNVGTSPITVSQVFLDPSSSPDFTLEPFTTPVVIAAGSQSVVSVRFHPQASGVQTGALFVVHSASSLPEVVPLTGQGEANPSVTDNFQQNATQSADVLFVVDNSQSMANNQANLGANFAAFIAAAVSQTIDYHIAVTTTDVCTTIDSTIQCDALGAAGAFVGTPNYLTPQTPNVAAEFQTRVTVGTDGSGEERGLEAAYLALSDPLINTTNAGFLRPDAALAVIVVSDDDDSRQDGIPGGPNETLIASARPVTFYENFFQNLKGFDASLFSFNAIIEPHQGDCNGTGEHVEASGYRYGLVAAATGGEVERICGADWGQTLSQIGLNTFGLKRKFGLSSQPVPASITVTVNGSSAPSTAWTYDAAANAVVFGAGSVPPVHASVTITYQVACLP